MSEPLSEVAPPKKMKQSRLPFQVLPASSPQPGKKRKLSGEDAASVPKSPRSSATSADVENIPCSASPDTETKGAKKTADPAEVPNKGASIKNFFQKTISSVTKEELSPKQNTKKEVVIDDDLLESLPRGQEQENGSQDEQNPTSVEKEAGELFVEPRSSTPSFSADVSESEDMADVIDTTDTSCRETSIQSEDPGSTASSQEASPTASSQEASPTAPCDKPDGKVDPDDAFGSELTGKEVDGKEVPKAAKSGKPAQTLTKAERERRHQEKIAERERQRKERADLKAKREEEKLAKQRLREENKLRKQQLLEELSKQKEERKRAKEAELQKREEEKQKREEERQKKEEERQKKEEERQKKEEERQKKEEEKKRAKEEQEKKQQKEKAIFANFFVKRTEPKQASEGGGGSAAAAVGAFRPFQLKDGMTLASFVPQDVLRHFDASALDQLLQAQDASEKGWLARKAFPRRTLQTPRRQEQRPRAKLLQFCENVRPAYWGTWRKKSQAVSGRRPWGKEKELDYEVDSEEEWEEEEPGESLSGTEDEKESEDDYEVDNDVFVPHGYLSEDEEKGDNDPMTPETLKARLKLRQEELQAELKSSTARPMRPLVVGCIWQTTGLDPGQQGAGCLDQFAAVRLTLSFRPSWEVREEALQKSAQPLPDAGKQLRDACNT
ncbi:chromatin assembly factor 1 subunit A [Ixodes scapularis]